MFTLNIHVNRTTIVQVVNNWYRWTILLKSKRQFNNTCTDIHKQLHVDHNQQNEIVGRW